MLLSRLISKRTQNQFNQLSNGVFQGIIKQSQIYLRRFSFFGVSSPIFNSEKNDDHQHFKSSSILVNLKYQQEMMRIKIDVSLSSLLE